MNPAAAGEAFGGNQKWRASQSRRAILSYRLRRSSGGEDRLDGGKALGRLGAVRSAALGEVR
ncbi:MAG TPA: hypothetical protein VIP08_14825, partial [Phenylobacterium sp.]